MALYISQARRSLVSFDAMCSVPSYSDPYFRTLVVHFKVNRDRIRVGLTWKGLALPLHRGSVCLEWSASCQRSGVFCPSESPCNLCSIQAGK